MQRLDKLLVERGLAVTRTQAQKLIGAALVEVKTAGQWQVQTKPSIKFAPDSELRTGDHPELRYVSRAGLKLEAVLLERKINVEGLVAIDIGQSTGGFTDCLLKHGAAQVVGIEVGHEQLAASLRDNPKVLCLEGYNARQLDQSVLDHIEGNFDIAV
ncbi:MAG TPA: SAM-dependent methyltransferase, partial [Marinagarivorans sp.]